MFQYMTRITAVLTLSASLAALGCTEKKNDTLAQDTSLNRDMQLANANSTATPALKDVPTTTTPTPAPATSAPAPRTTTRTTTRSTRTRTTTAPVATTTTPSGNTVTRNSRGAGAAMGVIASGSTNNLASNSRVCTNTNHVGDHFTATVTQAISGPSG